jgi:hypothetical protein
MSSNRISRFLAADFSYAAAFTPVASHAGAAMGAANHSQNTAVMHSTMVAMPSITLASWQEQVYRLAYQKALADTAPPRHFARFFSVWN